MRPTGGSLGGWVRALALMLAAPLTLHATETATPSPTPLPGGAIFFDDFNGDQGWTWGLAWERGANGGGPDPAQGRGGPGDAWAGTILGSYAPTGMIATFLSSPVIDASGVSGPLELRFWRWVDCDQSPYNQLSVQAYYNGAYYVLWNSSAALHENAWNQVVYDLSPYKSSQLRIRFSWAPWPGALPSGGWNIDEVAVGPLDPGTSPTPTASRTTSATATPTATPNGLDLDLDLPGQAFYSLGAGAWRSQSARALSGSSGAQSAPGGTFTGASSGLQSVFNGPGLLRFAWAVDTAPSDAWAVWSINGSNQDFIAGAQPFGWREAWLPPGPVTVNWRHFRQTYQMPVGDDCAYLDAVSFQPGTPSPTPTLSPSPDFSATPSATPMTAAFSDSFSSDQGWVLEGDFMRGQTGGPQDPPSDLDGDGWVLGTAVPGTVDPGNGPHTAESPPVDASALSSLRLRFASFMRCSYNSSASVQVWNGSTWVYIWGLSYGRYDLAWREQVLDLTPYRNAALRVRFTLYEPEIGNGGWSIDRLALESAAGAFSPTHTRTPLPTWTWTRTRTVSPSVTPTRSPTPPYSATASPTDTLSPTASPSFSASPSGTGTATAGPAPTLTPLPDGLLWDDFEGPGPGGWSYGSLGSGCSQSFGASPTNGAGGSRGWYFSFNDDCTASHPYYVARRSWSSAALDVSAAHAISLKVWSDAPVWLSLTLQDASAARFVSPRFYLAGTGWETVLVPKEDWQNSSVGYSGVNWGSVAQLGLAAQPLLKGNHYVVVDDVWFLLPAPGSSPTSTRSITRSPTISPTRTPTYSWTASPTRSRTRSFTVSPTLTATPSITPTFSVSPTATPSFTPDAIAPALDQPGLQFIQASDWAPAEAWVAQSAISHDGVSAGLMQPTAPYRGARLSLTLNGPATLSWWWLGQGAAPDAYYGFYVSLDGVSAGSYGKSGQWTKAQVDVPFGAHTVTWTFSAWDSVGPRGYLDQLQIVYGTLTPSPSYTVSPTITRTITPIPTPPIEAGRAYAFPAPAHVNERITLRFEPSASAEISLFDLAGRDLEGRGLQVDAAHGLAWWRPDPEQHRPGVYFVRIRLPGGDRHLRLVLLP